MKKCLACGSDQLADGDIVSGGLQLLVSGTPVEFKPEGSKGNLTIFGVACINCGHIEMVVDQEVLRKRIKKNEKK